MSEIQVAAQLAADRIAWGGVYSRDAMAQIIDRVFRDELAPLRYQRALLLDAAVEALAAGPAADWGKLRKAIAAARGHE